MYMDFIDKFLTDYFAQSKSKGDEALIDYFKAFKGVCFEDRAKMLEEYAIHHPLVQDGTMNLIAEIADWTESTPVEVVWIKEATLLSNKLDKIPTPSELLKHLEEKGIFAFEFATKQDIRAKATKEEYLKWANQQVELFILEADILQNTQKVDL